MFVVLCGTAPPSASALEARYTVRRGDNLTVIARRYGTTVAALTRVNGLASDRLGVGQILRIPAPWSDGQPGEPRWERPARQLGEVLRPFGPYQLGSVRMDRRGVDLACAPGEVVSAPATGVVRFLGPLEGYGHLAILDHGGGWATVLSPLDPAHLAVQEGTAVLAGDRLGLVGEPVEEGPTYLHLELRRDERAIAPDRLLK